MSQVAGDAARIVAGELERPGQVYDEIVTRLANDEDRPGDAKNVARAMQLLGRDAAKLNQDIEHRRRVIAAQDELDQAERALAAMPTDQAIAAELAEADAGLELVVQRLHQQKRQLLAAREQRQLAAGEVRNARTRLNSAETETD